MTVVYRTQGGWPADAGAIRALEKHKAGTSDELGQ